MWSDITFWVSIAIAVYVVWRTILLSGRAVKPMPRDPDLEGLIYSRHLQPGHFYFFVYDCRSLSHKKCVDVSTMLTKRGIENVFLRTRGIPPIVYDLKRPEEPVKGVDHE